MTPETNNAAGRENAPAPATPDDDIRRAVDWNRTVVGLCMSAMLGMAGQQGVPKVTNAAAMK